MTDVSVWAVTQGCYSDYSVDEIFETEADAKAYADAMNDGKGDDGYGYRVERFPFWRAGTGPKVQKVWVAGWPRIAIGSKITGDPIWFRQEITTSEPPSRPSVSEGPTYVTARCADRDAAIKAVKDRVAARLALSPTQEAGPSDE